MTTQVTFDAATLADAVGKAARVAPNKGAAFDKAAGILFEVDPTTGLVDIMTNNIDSTYRQRLHVTDAKGDIVKWRIPSAMLAGLVAQLPMGTGATVKFVDRGDQAIRIVAGSVKVKLTTIDPDGFPKTPAFTPTGMSEANDFAKKVAQVSWACAKDNSILSGVHVDGKFLIGCDRQIAALIPCEAKVDEPVTVPLGILSNILKQATDVAIRVEDRKLLIQLDAESQATSNIIEGAYPKVDALRRTDYSGTAMIPKTAFVESLERLLVVARTERLPACTLTFTPGLTRSLVLDLETDDAHRIQDTIDVGGDFDDPFKVGFNPQYLLSGINNSKAEMVKFEYGTTDPSKIARAADLPCRITDESGYECLIAVRRLGATS